MNLNTKIKEATLMKIKMNINIKNNLYSADSHKIEGRNQTILTTLAG
jgi:hypothetical protein